MPDISTGWQMIQMAAEVASLHLDKHWVKTWLRIDWDRISKTKHSMRVLKGNVDHLFKDTEEVINTIWAELA
ncbi:hypothetical protein ABIE79_010076 [Bradyrhizobium diazoefficiens]